MPFQLSAFFSDSAFSLQLSAFSVSAFSVSSFSSRFTFFRLFI
jgi:hypothetical protein